MIQRIRIDDRLLHGQVAYSWKSKLNYDAIVIANDAAANDEMRKTTIKLCCPDGVRLATRTIVQAATLLKNEKLRGMKVFVICANPKDVYMLLQLIDEKPLINVGGMQMADGKVLFAKAVYVNKEDITFLDKLEANHYTVEVQEVPSTAINSYTGLRKKINL